MTTENIASFDFYDLLCIQQLLCNPALENALSFFQDGMIDTLAYYRTKIYLERQERLFGCRVLFKSKIDYPAQYLERAFLSQENSIEFANITNNNTIIERAGSHEHDQEAIGVSLTPLFALHRSRAIGTIHVDNTMNYSDTSQNNNGNRLEII